jgi:hypothetical protein
LYVLKMLLGDPPNPRQQSGQVQLHRFLTPLAKRGENIFRKGELNDWLLTNKFQNSLLKK